MKQLSLFAFAVALLAAPALGHADDKHAAMYEECARACNDCQRACDMCSAHCAKMAADGKREHLTTMQTCQDCATCCAAAAGIVSRKGPFSDITCTACADACKRCGEHCDKFKDSPIMKQCADECRKCEKACRAMLKHFVDSK